MLENLDQVVINLPPSQQLMLRLILAFLMFSVALDIKKSDFELLFRSPKAVFVGLGILWFVLPVLTLGLVWAFRPPASVALGMILIAACPGGTLSNFATHWARGNTALAVTTTTLSTLASVATLPVTFFVGKTLISNVLQVPNISISFLDLVEIVSIVIFAPLLLGMAIGHFFPTQNELLKRFVKPFSLLIFVVFIVGAVASNWKLVRDYVPLIFTINMLHNGLMMFLGYLTAKFFNLSEASARALTFESGLHNTALGLTLTLAFFNGLGGMIVLLAWYGIWDLMTASALALFWMKKGEK
ncbi:MAG: hypothetical protein RL757_1062 [Bacteroidota bacterium]|jgi:BASS family bile acid:Na+ symporter